MDAIWSLLPSVLSLGFHATESLGSVWNGGMSLLDQMGLAAAALAPVAVAAIKYAVSRRLPGPVAYAISWVAFLLVLQLYVHPYVEQYNVFKLEHVNMKYDYDGVCIDRHPSSRRFIDACVMTAADLSMWPSLHAHKIVVDRMYGTARDWLTSWVTTTVGAGLAVAVLQHLMRRGARLLDERRIAHAKDAYLAQHCAPTTAMGLGGSDG